MQTVGGKSHNNEDSWKDNGTNGLPMPYHGPSCRTSGPRQNNITSAAIKKKTTE